MRKKVKLGSVQLKRKELEGKTRQSIIENDDEKEEVPSEIKNIAHNDDSVVAEKIDDSKPSNDYDTILAEDSKGHALSPLKIDGSYVCIKREDTNVGPRSQEILQRVPKFKGIKVRVPGFYVLNAKDRRH